MEIEPIEKYVKRIRLEHENRNYLRTLMQDSSKNIVINHMRTVLNESFVCLKPRDKIKTKNLLGTAA